MHPGRFLERQFLKPLNLTQGQAARLLGVSRRRLNEIVVGRRSLSADTALRCAMAFGLDASFWMAQQSRWDSFQAWKAWRAESATAPTGDALPRQKASSPRPAEGAPLSRRGTTAAHFFGLSRLPAASAAATVDAH
jgi:addiction module HigA family antidote